MQGSQTGWWCHRSPCQGTGAGRRKQSPYFATLSQLHFPHTGPAPGKLLQHAAAHKAVLAWLGHDHDGGGDVGHGNDGGGDVGHDDDGDGNVVHGGDGDGDAGHGGDARVLIEGWAEHED